jgi:hypothetical protein
MARRRKMKNNQKGFSAVEALIIVVVMAAIGGIGFYIYNKQKDDDKAKKSVEHSQTEKSSEKNEEEHSEAEETDPHIDITEWGIEIKISGADKVTYQITNEPGETHQGDAYVASAGLSLAASVTTDPDCQSLGLGVYRATSQPQYLTAKKVGDHYYWITGGPGSCGIEKVDKVRMDIINQLHTDVIE